MTLIHQKLLAGSAAALLGFGLLTSNAQAQLSESGLVGELEGPTLV